MGPVRLLDCTLREAPVDGFFIGEDFMGSFVHRCERVGVDIIECGFLKDVEYIPGSNCFNDVGKIRDLISPKQTDTMYVALMDQGRYDPSGLALYDGTSIDGVRICFKHGQQDEAIRTAKTIQEKGYKVFIQHVDTLDYTDIEIINFIEQVNQIRPYAYAIVDTFGSMYEDDLKRLALLIDHHLDQGIILGFHAHDNLMLANANAQAFISLYAGKRSIIVDTSVLGCGRGAGNAHTELLAEYLNKKYHSRYDIDEILDLIDSVMPRLQIRCSWGYDVPYFLSGVHGAHVYNVDHLLRRHNITLKDLRAIIEKLDDRQKKTYDYKLLEKLYVEYFDRKVDDQKERAIFERALQGRPILLLAPGKTLKTERERIRVFIEKEDPVVVGINDKISDFKVGYIFFSSANRYNEYRRRDLGESGPSIIITSNIHQEVRWKDEMVVDYGSLIRYGWVNLDSSMIMLLRLITGLGIKKIHIAGFDGFSENNEENYYSTDLCTGMKKEDLILMTRENKEMLAEILEEDPQIHIDFITDSMYEDVIKDARKKI